MPRPDLWPLRGLLPSELVDALEKDSRFEDVDPGALATQTREFHATIITPESEKGAPEPTVGEIGSLLVANYTVNTDRGYQLYKIPKNFTGDPTFHIHWTKESTAFGDTDQSGNSVRWRLSYTVFPGATTDVNGTPTVIDVDDTYDDAGTTTRIVHRTADIMLMGFIADYYVGLSLEAVTPAGSALTCKPALIAADLVYTEFINQ